MYMVMVCGLNVPFIMMFCDRGLNCAMMHNCLPPIRSRRCRRNSVVFHCKVLPADLLNLHEQHAVCWPSVGPQNIKPQIKASKIVKVIL